MSTIVEKIRENEKLYKCLVGIARKYEHFKRIIIGSKVKEIDISIFECHHKTKQDSPSGTAIYLQKTIKNNLNITPEIVSSRIGNTVGIHKITFSTPDEEIIITHKALNRKPFSIGITNEINKICKNIKEINREKY